MPTRPELVGNFGMVGATHWLAASTGMSVLEAGGNAFDAAVAAGFVLQVVEPHLSGPLGEVPAIVWSERDQEVAVVCGQGVAPRAATVDHFTHDLGLDIVPGTGLLAATVPGAFGGWLLLLERWGTWRLRDVLGYAIGYARTGFPAAPLLANAISTVAAMFRDDWPPSAEVWLRQGGLPRGVPGPGDRIRLPGLAATYERIVTEAERAGGGREGEIRAARHAWYRGFVADAIVDFCRQAPWLDTSGEAHRGLLDSDDLAGWEATIERPATYDFREYTLCKTGPWGQGPVFLQQLALLDALDVWSVPHGSADYLHVVIEAAKLAYADREAWYGDSGTVPDLVQHLLDPAYNAERAALIGDDASLDLRPGRVAGREPQLGVLDTAALADGAGVGEPTLGSRGRVEGDTCHVDVVDQWGNMVSATPSGGWLQSSPVIPELGFCLGTRAQMFSLEHGHPNELRPGARPRTTLTPPPTLRGGRPRTAFGNPGGDQQDQWSLAFFLSVVQGGLDLQAAIDAPAFTSQHFPSSFYPRAARPGHLVMEDRFPAEVVDDLRRRGHDIELTGPWVLGRVSAVARGDDGFLHAAANPRGASGYAVGR